MLDKGQVTLSEAQRILRDCRQVLKSDDTLELSQVLSGINEDLDAFHYSLLITGDHSTGQQCLYFLNTRADVLTQSATDLSPLEIQFLRKVIDMIVTASDWQYACSSTDAINLASQLGTSETPAKISLTAGEQVLKKLMKRGWLATTQSGGVKLTTRAVLELTTYLRDSFMDIYPCAVCGYLVTEGVRLRLDDQQQEAWKLVNPPGENDEEVNVLMHRHCSVGHFAMTDKLPGTSISFDRHKVDEVGQRSTSENGVEGGGTDSQGGLETQPRRARSTRDTAQTQSSLRDDGPTQSSRRTQSQRGGTQAETQQSENLAPPNQAEAESEADAESETQDVKVPSNQNARARQTKSKAAATPSTGTTISSKRRRSPSGSSDTHSEAPIVRTRQKRRVAASDDSE